MPDQVPDENTSLDQLTPEEASRIIHSHRKVRYGEFCTLLSPGILQPYLAPTNGFGSYL